LKNLLPNGFAIHHAGMSRLYEYHQYLYLKCVSNTTKRERREGGRERKEKFQFSQQYPLFNILTLDY